MEIVFFKKCIIKKSERMNIVLLVAKWEPMAGKADEGNANDHL